MSTFIRVRQQMSAFVGVRIRMSRFRRNPAANVRVRRQSGCGCPHSLRSQVAGALATRGTYQSLRPTWEDIKLGRKTLGAKLVCTLGAQLATYRGNEDTAGLRSEANIRIVQWLFADVRRRLAAVTRAGAGPAEVIVGHRSAATPKKDRAVELLLRGSGEAHWTLAIECLSHPFHTEWLELKKWAMTEGLYLRGRAALDPVCSTCVYYVSAWPALV